MTRTNHVLTCYTQHVRKYETLAGGGEVLESHLATALPEYLNAEVALKTVPDVSEAVRWLKSTFMYLRVRDTLVLVARVCYETHGTDLSQPGLVRHPWGWSGPGAPTAAALCADHRGKPDRARLCVHRPGRLCAACRGAGRDHGTGDGHTCGVVMHF